MHPWHLEVKNPRFVGLLSQWRVLRRLHARLHLGPRGAHSHSDRLAGLGRQNLLLHLLMQEKYGLLRYQANVHTLERQRFPILECLVIRIVLQSTDILRAVGQERHQES